jgi:hypothetical protein
LKAARLSIIQRFGFCSDPNKNKKHNFYDALKQLQQLQNIDTTPNTTNKNLKLQLQQPKNLTVHNLCKGFQPPLDTEKLLGLGLKYCVAPSKPSVCIKDCIKKLAYRIRTKQYLLTENRQSEREYIPQIYVKLKNWDPPPASLTTERNSYDQ